jgi:hypothetical protein
VPRARLVPAVFGVLVLATVGAFVAAQRLKAERPLVLRFITQPKAFSPNGDRLGDTARVGFVLSERAKVSFYVTDDDGNQVRRLVDGRTLPGDRRYYYRWNGRDDSGKRVRDGIYRLRLVRNDAQRTLDSFKDVKVDTVKPRVRLVSARPGVLHPGLPGSPGGVVIRYAGPINAHPEFRIFRTDEGGAPRVVARFRGHARSAIWHGTIRGRPADDGDYAFTVTVRDPAGNTSVAPATVPTPRTARPGTGVAVRRLTLTGPDGVVSPGSIARLKLGPVTQRFSFALTRSGSGKVLRRDSRRGSTLRVKVPASARSGVYFVRVRTAEGQTASWPLAVAGLPLARSGASRPRPLVILPVTTWQGLNPYDGNLDGFGDTLDDSPRISLERSYAGGGAPPGFNAEAGPLLRFLDRAKLPYDLTTDVALARGEGPRLGNAPGAAFAGTERWLPSTLRGRLRSYVDGGGKVASFGAGALKRSVLLKGDVASDPATSRTDIFGERTVPFRTEGAAPLNVDRDRLRLFAGVGPVFGEFTRFEVSRGLGAGARLLSGAGRDPGRPAFVAYRLGKGTVIRAGSAQWSSQLRERSFGADVQRVTRRIWSRLGGR